VGHQGSVKQVKFFQLLWAIPLLNPACNSGATGGQSGSAFLLVS